MRKIISLLFCLISITGFAQKKITQTDQFKGLDTAFARILKDWKAAGFAVAVVKKDKVIYAKGFGYKDWEAKAPVTEQTQFAIGSCTKAFTASLIGMLNKEGSVDIDKPVRNYIPALNFYNNEMNNNVTLRDMMCHRTGVSRYDYSWYFFPSRSKDTLMQRMKYMEPSEPLRSKWQYNNFMFMLQGLVVEKLTAKSWEDNIKEKIFVPLGMNNSNTTLTQWMQAKDLAVGYNLIHDSVIHKSDYFDISGMAPAGSINSSVSDMAKWLTLWINGGKYQGKEIIPAQYVTEAMSSQMVMAGALPSTDRADMYLSNYGFGWMLSSYRGHYRVEHGGNIDGFSASTCFFPSDSIGIVVLCNQNGSQVPAMVRNLISDRLLGLTYRDWQTQFYGSDTAAKAKAKVVMKTVVSDQKTGTTPSHSLKEYIGLYTAPGKEKFELALQHDSLFMLVPNQKLYLRHYHYDVFNLWDKDDLIDNDTTNNKGIKILFRMDESGNIASASMPLEGAEKPIVFTKGAIPKPLLKDSLLKYEGDYTLAGTIVKVYIKGENTLYVFVPDQPEYELVATDMDKFNLKILPAYSVLFTKNAKGEISELTFIQPNGNFKATKVVKQ
jgi:CubicO group peptidase (beta-lactamase class C family)